MTPVRSPAALGRARTGINSNPHSLRAANSFHIASSYRRTYAIKFSRLKNEHVIDSGSEPAFSAPTVSSFKKNGQDQIKSQGVLRFPN